MVSPESIGQQGLLSVWHATYLFTRTSRAKFYLRETEIEKVRQTKFPSKVSRLSGLYFFEDRDTALHAGQRWEGNFREEYLTEIQFVGQPKISKYDSEWISNYRAFSEAYWIENYLKGQAMGPLPLWELLVEGRGFILGTHIRKLAYETVRQTWPKSLGLLELSRIAVELDSDLGLISPILTGNENRASLKLYLDFEDAQNPVFLDKLKKYQGPKNTTDLNINSDLVLPDLSNYFVEFEV